jgi:molybdopterin-guanine dinucleotide biosynthesis protein A
MAFPKNGVVEAGKIVPSAFGLLAVVKPENSVDEDMWIRGFSQEYETTVNNLKNWDDTDTTSYTLVNNATVNYYDEIKPFFIEIDEVRSTLGFLGIDRIERLKRQLEGVTQKALEHELWNGEIRIAEGHDNKALVSSSVTVINSGVALSPKRALALLEHSIADVSHGGEQGVIHATRDVVALLASNSNMLFHEKDKDHLQTMGGTPVIVGSGYSGDGPIIAVSTAAISTNTTLTLNTSSDHYLVTGDTVRFLVDGANIDQSSASATVTRVDADTVTITIASATNATSEAVTGYIQQLGTASAKWIYATGKVRTYVGEIDVVNDNLAQAYDVSGNKNDMRIKAIRPVAVYFGTSIHLAVRVDLTA